MDDRLADYLKTRRTIPASQLGEPGPDSDTLRAILTIAARVPDHGKLAPWRFVVFKGERRAAAIAALTKIAERQADPTEQKRRASQAKGFGDSPIVVAVISAPIVDHPKIPVWEQQLSAGAVGMNLLHAAKAHGFAAQWLTGWYAYDEEARGLLGLKPEERVAGFIHIGTPTMPPTERDRPDVAALTMEWGAGT